MTTPSRIDLAESRLPRGARHAPGRRAVRLARCGGLLLLAVVASATAVSAAVRPALESRRTMVVMPEPEAARAALEVLRAGGNAVDAAVAAAFALAVTYPEAGNLGGGGFMLVRPASGPAWVVDYRETAPAAASRDMFLDPNGQVVPALATEGALAAGVPGTVAGLAMAAEIGGSLPWKRLLAPAVELAAEGFRVPADLSRRILEEREKLLRSGAAAAIFLPGGSPPAPGSLLRQPDLARTLRLLAEEGGSAFYRGAVARAIAGAMRERGGRITAADLEGYRAQRREPMRFAFREHVVLAPPLPSAGGVLLAQMLGMLEPFDLRALGAGSSAHWHLLAEVMKRAYADRAAWLGDPAFVPVPLAGLLDPAYLRDRMASFDPDRAGPASPVRPGLPRGAEGAHTTHFAIADAGGTIVANTYTLNEWFGSGLMIDGWGFLMNNEMDDFSARPGAPNVYGLTGGEANAIAPRKRMLSSMTPMIVEREGRPVLVLGTPGGGRIPTMLLQVFLNVTVHGMELQQAVDAPRCHHQWEPDRISCEEGALPADVLENLRRRGHTVVFNEPRGDVMAIRIDAATGTLRGAADARGRGVALGD